MNEKKQLDCQLHCVASECLNNSVANDMDKEDKNLEELINGCSKAPEDTDQAGD